jgi:hypothetical protein
MNLPNDMASSIMNCVGDQAHEANGASSVDQVDAPLHLQQKGKTNQGQAKMLGFFPFFLK